MRKAGFFPEIGLDSSADGIGESDMEPHIDCDVIASRDPLWLL